MHFRTLTDDDIFISYTHLDGGTYATGLADELTKRGFSCFVDRLGTEPSKGLPDSLRRKIRGCAMLVIVGTERAGTRQAIEDEIKEFLSRGRRSSIVPVDFGSAVYRARWYGLIEGVAPESEKSVSALEDGNPSPSVVGRIEKQFSYTRRNQRLRQVTLATTALLALLILVSVAASIYAAQKLASAAEAKNQAAHARGDAEAAQRETTKAREAEQAAKSLAEYAKDEAGTQKEVAEKATIKAHVQTELADVATHQAATATAEARDAKAAGDRQRAIADSRLLANRSQRLVQMGSLQVPHGISVAVEALRRAPIEEADAALRQGLSLLSSRQGSERYAGDILDAELSSDGDHFAILTSANVLQIYKSGARTPSSEFPCRRRRVTSNQLDERLIAVSNEAAYAAVVFGNEAMVLNLKESHSHTIKLVDDGFFISRIAISPSGKYLAFVYYRQDGRPFIGARVVEVSSGRVIKSFGEDLGIVIGAIAYGSNGDLVFSGSVLAQDEQSSPKTLRNSWRVIIWPLSAKARGGEPGHEITSEDFAHRIEASIAGDQPRELAVGHDYSLIATESVVWQMTPTREYEAIAIVPDTQSVNGQPSGERRLAFNRQGTQLIVLMSKYVHASSLTAAKPFGFEDFRSLQKQSRANWTLERWDSTGYREAVRVSSRASIWSLSFAPDGQTIRTANGPQSRVQCLRTKDGQDVYSAEVGQRQTSDLVLAIGPNLDVTITADTKSAFVTRVCDSVKIPVPFGSDLKLVSEAAITSDNRFLALVGLSGEANASVVADVYRLHGNLYERWKRLHLPHMPLGVSLAAGGKFLMTHSDNGTPQIWDVRNGLVLTFAGLQKRLIAAMGFSPDGQFLVEVDVDNLTPHDAFTRVWRLEDRKEIAVFDHRWPFGFQPPLIVSSPSGRMFLESGNVTRLVDFNSGRTLHLFDVMSAQSAAFSPDERYLAIATLEGEVLVYRTDVLEEPLLRLQHTDVVTALAISPDNRYVATASSVYKGYPVADENYLLRVWALQPEDLIKEATERLSVIPQIPH